MALRGGEQKQERLPLAKLLQLNYKSLERRGEAPIEQSLTSFFANAVFSTRSSYVDAKFGDLSARTQAYLATAGIEPFEAINFFDDAAVARYMQNAISIAIAELFDPDKGYAIRPEIMEIIEQQFALMYGPRDAADDARAAAIAAKKTELGWDLVTEKGIENFKHMLLKEWCFKILDGQLGQVTGRVDITKPLQERTGLQPGDFSEMLRLRRQQLRYLYQLSIRFTPGNLAARKVSDETYHLDSEYTSMQDLAESFSTEACQSVAAQVVSEEFVQGKGKRDVAERFLGSDVVRQVCPLSDEEKDTPKSAADSTVLLRLSQAYGICAIESVALEALDKRLVLHDSGRHPQPCDILRINFFDDAEVIKYFEYYISTAVQAMYDETGALTPDFQRILEHHPDVGNPKELVRVLVFNSLAGQVAKMSNSAYVNPLLKNKNPPRDFHRMCTSRSKQLEAVVKNMETALLDRGDGELPVPVQLQQCQIAEVCQKVLAEVPYKVRGAATPLADDLKEFDAAMRLDSIKAMIIDQAKKGFGYKRGKGKILPGMQDEQKQDLNGPATLSKIAGVITAQDGRTAREKLVAVHALASGKCKKETWINIHGAPIHDNFPGVETGRAGTAVLYTSIYAGSNPDFDHRPVFRFLQCDSVPVAQQPVLAEAAEEVSEEEEDWEAELGALPAGRPRSGGHKRGQSSMADIAALLDGADDDAAPIVDVPLQRERGDGAQRALHLQGLFGDDYEDWRPGQDAQAQQVGKELSLAELARLQQTRERRHAEPPPVRLQTAADGDDDTPQPKQPPSPGGAAGK